MQPAFDGPVRECSHIGWSHVSGFAFLDGRAHANQQNFSHQRGNRSHDRLHAFRQLLARSLHAFLHQHAGLVDVGVPAEFGIDERQGHIAVRSQSTESRHSHECALDGLGDAGFHFLRRKSGRFREDDDRRFGEVRQHLDGELRCGAQTHDHEDQGNPEDDRPVGERPVNHFIQHGSVAFRIGIGRALLFFT